MLTPATEARLELLQAASDTIADEAREALAEQGKKAAANMLQMYGSKSCLDAGGFIYCVQNAHDAALLWLLTEGYAVLTPKALATKEVEESRKAKRSLAVKGFGDNPAPDIAKPEPGAYL